MRIIGPGKPTHLAYLHFPLFYTITTSKAASGTLPVGGFRFPLAMQ